MRTATALSAVLLVSLAARAQAEAPAPPPREVRAAFLRMLDRPRIPLDPRPGETKIGDGSAGTSGRAGTGGSANLAQVPSALATERLSIATEKKHDGAVERVPMVIVRPARAAGRRPAVIVLHGTGGSKDGQREHETLVRLAGKGIIAIAIDARYHGDRAGGAGGADAYNAAILTAWRARTTAEQEHPFYYDTVWDLWRTIDYLQGRPDVDPTRLGMIGFSMGGIETWLAASVDERIKVAVPAIAVQSFRWSLEHDQWQGRAKTIQLAHQAAARDLGEPAVNARVCRALWNKVIPGMLDQFDCPSMLRLFAPRPLLILSGELDPNNPLGGARLGFAAAETAYRTAGASDRLRIILAPGVAHKVTDEQQQAALDWFVTWLAP
jgi:dienelactone hydrolase